MQFDSEKLGQVTAIAVLGKSGFNHLKRLLVRIPSTGRSSSLLPRFDFVHGAVLMTWAEPYVAILGAGSVYLLLQDLPLELLLLVGLFLLGGEFWDKVRALFRQGAKVEIVPETSAAPA